MSLLHRILYHLPHRFLVIRLFLYYTVDLLPRFLYIQAHHCGRHSRPRPYVLLQGYQRVHSQGLQKWRSVCVCVCVCVGVCVLHNGSQMWRCFLSLSLSGFSLALFSSPSPSPSPSPCRAQGQAALNLFCLMCCSPYLSRSLSLSPVLFHGAACMSCRRKASFTSALKAPYTSTERPHAIVP